MALRERLGRILGFIPLPLRILVVVGALFGLFISVVGPLFTSSEVPVAEVDGSLPSTLPAGHAASLQLAVDNTGFAVVNPICITGDFKGAVTQFTVNFDGLDNVQATNGRACAPGLLTAQETMPITLNFTTPPKGSLSVAVGISQGTTTVGTPLAGTISLTSS